MKEYILTEEEIKSLKRCLDPDMGHSAFWMINEITTNILPELFEKDFEVGKYYKSESNLYFKCTKIVGKNVMGYGLDTSGFCNDSIPWAIIEDGRSIDDYNMEELTREEFLAHIRTYAIEELGFKKGVVFNNTSIYTNIIANNSEIHGEIEINYSSSIDSLECEVENGYTDVIFKDGKFAEIIKQPKQTPTSTWAATNHLRYITNSIGEKVLQQKNVNVETGEEKWNYIETV